MQIPILNGMYTNENNDIRIDYPVNLSPIVFSTTISDGYLRPCDGVSELCAVSGIDRGGINWNGVCYRVVGHDLVSVTENGAITKFYGGILGSDTVIFDYSFDYLAICADSKLWLFDGSTVTQVTDTDLGNALDVVFVDGYFMTTDGTSLVVTELNNPFSVNPLKYGSSEVDPDPITSLIKIKNEVYAINRYTIEVFDNVGGDFFPFQRIDGAVISKGALSPFTCCYFMDMVAFIGSGKNERISVYLASSGQSSKISTRDIDFILNQYTESQLANSLIERKTGDNQELLLIHLPDKTLCYDHTTSKALNTYVWYVLSSAGDGVGAYNIRNHVFCYNKWMVGHPTLPKLGYLSDNIGSHWGDNVAWSFSTFILYNESKGAIFNQLELVVLNGRNLLGTNPQIKTSYSLDGMQWSVDRYISAGKQGEREKRLIWLQNGTMRQWRVQRFSGTSDAKMTMIRLEATIEALTV